MPTFLSRNKRTKSNGQFRAGDVGSEAVVYGWVQSFRDHGGVIFIDLRDRTGLVQLRCEPSPHADAHRIALHDSHHRLFASVDGLDASMPTVVHVAPDFGRRFLGQVAGIGARAEIAAGAREQHGPHGRLLIDALERVGKRFAHLLRHGIHALGAVERDGGQCTFDFHTDRHGAFRIIVAVIV